MLRLRNKKGFTFMELIVAMAIFIIMGASVLTLLQTGLHSSDAVTDDMRQETEARTAMSLVTVQLRQHDFTDGIKVVSATQIRLIDDFSTSAGTVIWYDGTGTEGVLYAQSYGNLNEVTTAGEKLAVAKISGFSVTQTAAEVDMSQNGTPDDTSDDVQVKITYTYTITIGYGDGRELSQTVTQRSNGVEI